MFFTGPRVLPISAWLVSELPRKSAQDVSIPDTAEHFRRLSPPTRYHRGRARPRHDLYYSPGLGCSRRSSG